MRTIAVRWIPVLGCLLVAAVAACSWDGGLIPWGDDEDGWPSAAELAGSCPTEGPAEVEPESAGEALAALRSLASCDDAALLVTEKLRRDARRQLERNLHAALSAYCQPCVPPPPNEWGYQDAAAPQPPSGGGEGGSASEYTETNTQVAGVDEADFIKNDGAYLYGLAAGQLQIIDAWPAAEAHVVSRTPIPGTPRRLYVHADRAVVFSSQGTGSPPTECTYGYDCEFTGDGVPALVTILDITDRAAPTVVRELTFSSAYLASRRIGTVVHAMLVLPQAPGPYLRTWPSGVAGGTLYCGQATWRSPEEIRAAFAALAEENERILDAYTMPDGHLPAFTDRRHLASGAVTDEGTLGDCRDLLLSDAGDGASFLSLVSFDLAALEPLSTTTILGRPGALYASAESIYVASRHYRDQAGAWFYGPDAGISDATAIHKFRVGPGAQTAYAASGVVKGRVLNQFALDEHEGHLRVATTSGWMAYSSLFVLAEQGDRLVPVGLVDQIEPHEDIRAVRFDGDVGYVVTFEKTDPLFVFDLSDPVAPSLEGELVIPGFSTYLHRIDPGHLLSIGFDADDQGDFSWFGGILLQIFDVTDMSDPRLLHREVIGSRGTASEAATNHLGFTWFGARDLLAVPMTVCEGGSGGSFGSTLSFCGLLVYAATVETGFELLGGVPQLDPASAGSTWGECYGWWSGSTSAVKRSVILEDWVFSVSLDRIQVASILDLSHPAVTIALQP